MDFSITPMTPDDRIPVMDIFNHYVENSFSAYPEDKLPYPAFDTFLALSGDLPTAVLKDGEGGILGFGMLRPYHPMPVFARAAEITYFIHEDHTGKGLGKVLLDHFEREGRAKGVTTLLASISSLNQGSIRFHARNGFAECGRFREIGTKRGEVFDMVWMQKML